MERVGLAATRRRKREPQSLFWQATGMPKPAVRTIARRRSPEQQGQADAVEGDEKADPVARAAARRWARDSLHSPTCGPCKSALGVRVRSLASLAAKPPFPRLACAGVLVQGRSNQSPDDDAR